MGFICYCLFGRPDATFDEMERKIIFNYLEKKYGKKIKDIKEDLIELSTTLIEDKNFLTELSNRI